MRTYLAGAAVAVLIGGSCGSNEEAAATLPVATTGVPSSSSLSTTTAGPSTTTEPTAAAVTSPTSSATPLPPPTPSRLPVTIEPTNVSHLTPAPEVSDDRPELRYLALGDSYTIGEGVDPALRWLVRLTERLRSAGVDIAAPEIVARTGWTTTELAVGIDGASPQGTFDIVTLLIGVNDQFRGQPVELFRQGFNGLLLRAIAFAGGSPSTVVVVSIPDWG